MSKPSRFVIINNTELRFWTGAEWSAPLDEAKTRRIYMGPRGFDEAMKIAVEQAAILVGDYGLESEVRLDLQWSRIPIAFTVDERRVVNLLISAFEYGSEYWIAAIVKVEPKDTQGNATYRHIYDREKVFDPEAPPMRIPHAEYPLLPGGAVIVQLDEAVDGKGLSHVLDRAAIEKGLKLFFSPAYSRHSCNWLNEEDDAETADVFLQLCLFGEIVYG